jgi:hypothetical protein
MEQAQEGLAHLIDAHWILALWIAIHGGDPAEKMGSEATTAIAGALVTQLAEQHRNLTEDPGDVLARLARLGFSIKIRTQDGREFELRNAEHLQSFVDTASAGGYGEQGKVRVIPLTLCLYGVFGVFCNTYWYRVGGPEEGEA